MGRYFWKQILPSWLGSHDVHWAGRTKVRWRLRQNTSLPPSCSNLRSFGSKCAVLKKVLITLLGLSGPSAVIWRPGNCALLPPSLRLRCYAMKIGRFFESKQIFKSERHEHLQVSNTIRHGSCTDWQPRLFAALQVSSCSFVSLLCLPHAFFRRGPVFVLRIIILFGHSTSCFLKLDKFEKNFWIVLKTASAPKLFSFCF